MHPDVRLPFWRAFAAFLAGDAVGNITPLGLVASEPTKVLLTRHRLATSESVASLAIDNMVYASSALTMVAVGVVVMLATVPLSSMREAAAFSLLAVVAGALIARGCGGKGARAGADPMAERLRGSRVGVTFWVEESRALARVSVGAGFTPRRWEMFFVLAG